MACQVQADCPQCCLIYISEHPNVVQIACGWKHNLALTFDGTMYAWGWGGSMGSSHALFGDNSSGGQLGLGNDFDYWEPTPLSSLMPSVGLPMIIGQHWKALHIACGFNHSAAVVEVMLDS